jgi:glycosyltransferase involved in cell wall biosynthesis
MCSAQRESDALTITVDVTWLGPHQTGAQVLTTAAIEALARQEHVKHLRLIGVDELPAYADHLAELNNVALVHPTELTEPSDVAWYPNQIDQRVDITYARSLGRRIITTYLDLIAYDIPRYHASPEAWRAYRSLQRRIALSVDGITTISADVAQRLMEEVPRIDSERIQPIPLGLDHITLTGDAADQDMAGLQSQLGNRPFVLVLGNDFQHKNRDFALRVWEQVLEGGVNCDLVLAGLHVKSSSSREAEEVLLAQHTNLRGSAHTLGHVSPDSRAWLLAHAAAVLYPSSAEGFGFVPYEAAALGTPSTFTAFGPLAELTGVSNAPRAWSVQAHADDLRALLTDPNAAKARVDALRASIAELTWDLFAHRLIEFVQRIDRLPPVEGALVGGTEGDAAALASILSSRTWRATAPFRRIGRRITRA